MNGKIEELMNENGRTYVRFSTREGCEAFLRQAEAEGFTFTDGAKPTERHVSDVIAVNSDRTINYVGTAGRIAFGSGAENVGGERLVRIEWI